MALRSAAMLTVRSLAGAAVASAAVIRIPDDQPTIQAGIDAAVSGDVIEIADGTYAGIGNRDLIITGKALTVRSASGNATACVIDCAGPDLYDWTHGFNVDGAATAGTVFENISIANASFKQVFRGEPPWGAGVAAFNTSVELQGVVLIACDVAGVWASSSDVTMTGCDVDGPGSDWYHIPLGLSINDGGSAAVTDCTVSSCGIGVGASQSQVTVTGSELVGNEMGFRALASSGVITGSTISLNSGATSVGGGLSFRDSTYDLENTTVSGNEYTARQWGSGDITFGGLRLTGTTVLSMTNCQVTGNRAVARDGGGISGTSPAVLLAEHCVVAGNSGHNGGGIAGTLQAVFTNCIVWGNCASGEGDDAYLGSGSDVRFECSDVGASGIAGPGTPIWIGTNLFTDPLFCEPASCVDAPVAGGHYALRTRTSPAYDHPECGRIGLLGEGCTLAVVPESWSRIKARYR